MTRDLEDVVRATRWSGMRSGDPVVVDLPRERRHRYEFVAFVKNTRTGECWVDVRSREHLDGRRRSFRPDVICPAVVRAGSVSAGPRLVDAPRLDMGGT